VTSFFWVPSTSWTRRRRGSSTRTFPPMALPVEATARTYSVPVRAQKREVLPDPAGPTSPIFAVTGLSAMMDVPRMR